MSCLVGCCASLTCGLCTSAASTITKKSARLGYCGLFGLSLIVSWLLREVGTPLLKKIPWINTSDTLSDEYFQMEAVLRLSLENCLFFTILALLLIGIKDQNDKRDAWHHGGWIFKIVIWALLIILMFFLPNPVSSVYGINTSDTLSDEYFQMEAVLRVSLGNCLFFTILALLLIGIKDQNDKRDAWHHGGWIFKIVIWALLIILMFFLPNPVSSVYGFISKFGAGFFLLVQVIILLDATHSWNDAWVAKDEQKWFVALLAVSITCYIAAFTISGLLFIWFNPSGNDCGLNVFFLVMTMIFALSFAIIALHPMVNGSLLPAAVISVYCAYVCYTGLSAEPRDYACNALPNKSKAVTTSTLVLGMFTTVLSVLYSALRAGSSTTFLSPPSSPRAGSGPGKTPKKEKTEEHPGRPPSRWYAQLHTGDRASLLDSEELEEGKGKKEAESKPVSYSYTFFHLIFALASMYSAMLLSGWSSSESSDLIDVGWTSVWVRICTEWVTAGLYIWSLVAPLLFPDREFY